MEEFITHRMNDLGANAPDAVTEAISKVGESMDNLAMLLTRDQISLMRELENALGLQTGEETRYYYRAGFGDAIQFLLEWRRAD